MGGEEGGEGNLEGYQDVIAEARNRGRDREGTEGIHGYIGARRRDIPFGESRRIAPLTCAPPKI